MPAAPPPPPPAWLVLLLLGVPDWRLLASLDPTPATALRLAEAMGGAAP